ncbi:MAG: TolC family protein, partial [Phycisphaerales bacterium]
MRTACRVALLATITTAPLVSQAPVRLSIGDVLGRADSAAEGIGIAEAGVRGAGARVRLARSAMLPQLSGAVTYTRTLETQFAALVDGGSDSASTPAPIGCGRFRPNPSLPIGARLDSLERGLDCTANGSSGVDFRSLPFGRPNQWNLGLEASQLLFDRALPARIRAANAGTERARATLDAERARTVLEAAQAYYDAQLASRLLAIAESTLMQAERTYDETALARRVGTAAEFDLLRASVARDNQKPLVIQRRTQRDQAFLRLRQLLDLAPETPLELTTPLA